MTTDEEKQDTKQRCRRTAGVSGGEYGEVNGGEFGEVSGGECADNPCSETSQLTSQLRSESDEMASCDEELMDLRYSLHASLKKKRRRRQTASQRKAANMRERKRMRLLNQAFDRLKRHIPNTMEHNRMSRMQTLKAAIAYIEYLYSLT